MFGKFVDYDHPDYPIFVQPGDILIYKHSSVLEMECPHLNHHLGQRTATSPPSFLHSHSLTDSSQSYSGEPPSSPLNRLSAKSPQVSVKGPGKRKMVDVDDDDVEFQASRPFPLNTSKRQKKSSDVIDLTHL